MTKRSTPSPSTRPISTRSPARASAISSKRSAAGRSNASTPAARTGVSSAWHESRLTWLASKLLKPQRLDGMQGSRFGGGVDAEEQPDARRDHEGGDHGGGADNGVPAADRGEQ